MEHKEQAKQQRITAAKPKRDVPFIIKIILLILLIILLIAQLSTGEWGKLQEGVTTSWFILFIKLLLIAILLGLIRVQRKLTCEITAPVGCTEEEINQTAGGLAVEVVGSAGGATFSHYTIEMRGVQGEDCQSNSDWSSEGVFYPGGGGTGVAPVSNGTLGWINTTVHSADAYEVRLCVYSYISSASRHCCCTQFELFKKLVWIERVAINPGAPVSTPPGPFTADAPIVNPSNEVVPVGGCVSVVGSAWVGECNNRKVKCFDLRYGIDFLPGPTQGGFNPADYTASLLAEPLCYVPPEEDGKRAPWNWVVGRELTTKLVKTEVDFYGTTLEVWKLRDYCFNSAASLPACPDAHHHCQSGKYTLLLEVEDTLGNMFYDTQHVWFDNKPIHVKFGGIKDLAACTDMSLSSVAPNGAPCDTIWPAELEGVVYDEYIDEADTTYPSDNFDFYTLRITRQGGPTYVVPITPDLLTFGPNPHRGTQRVGDPGVRCEDDIGSCSPVVPVPSAVMDVLTMIDLRIFDEKCMASLSAPIKPPAGFALERKSCCGYTFSLYARDKTWSDGWSGGYHRKWSLPWAVCICNDLPPAIGRD